MGRKTNYDKMTGSDWRQLLEDQPELAADKCDWAKLRGWDWSKLLQKQPQFADKCDWSKLDGWHWSELLQEQPQFADKCDWSKLHCRDWCWLLCKQPQFADKCDCWDDFGTDEWVFLLSDQPQFADKCDKWDEFEVGDVYDADWGGGDLTGFVWGWIELLRHQPQFAEKIDWSKFSQKDRDYLEEELGFAAEQDAEVYDDEEDYDEEDDEDGDDEDDDDEEDGDEDGYLTLADFISEISKDTSSDKKPAKKKAPATETPSKKSSKKNARTVAPAVVEGIIASMVPIPGKDYRMGKFQVTQAQWEAVMGENPSKYKGAKKPVENVSWDDCQVFLKKLNATPAAKASGLVFRLPEEDEWEFACRAGATGRYCKIADGTKITNKTLLKIVAWFEDNSDDKTHPVGQKKPNAFGLYDMHGNVAEWTASAVGMYRVYRGGGWSYSAACCESSYRLWHSPDARSSNLGFRLCAEEPLEKRALTVEPAVVEGIIASMVSIPGKDYRMGKFPVTQAQWMAVMGENPSAFKGAKNPVENVSWDDCQKFLEKLNATPAAKSSGLVFRLPEQDEWEYACRAGATGDYCKLADGTEITEETLGKVAWFEDNSKKRTHPVGQKTPNAFGLYDMHGNVWEWTASPADGEDRVRSGGSWYSSARFCESSLRRGYSPGVRGYILGFRLCASGRAD